MTILPTMQPGVREKMRIYPNIELSLGEKQGLGAAYAQGMKYAMEKMGADWVIEFDADFQHDPAYIPQLLNAARQGYDYVVGSVMFSAARSRDWNFSRLLTFVGQFCRPFYSFFPFEFKNAPRDLTSGLKATKVKDFWRKLIRPSSFKATLIKLRFLPDGKTGAKVKEIPIEFRNREKGNQNAAQSLPILQSGDKIASRRENAKLLKFAVVIVGYLVNALSLALLLLSWPETLCWLFQPSWRLFPIFGTTGLAKKSLPSPL